MQPKEFLTFKQKFCTSGLGPFLPFSRFQTIYIELMTGVWIRRSGVGQHTSYATSQRTADSSARVAVRI